MKYFLDTEFHEYKKQTKICGIKIGKAVDTIELISIGIATEDFRKYYALNKEFDIKAAWKNEWLRENVLRPIYDEHIKALMKSLTKFQSILHDLLMFRSLKKFNLNTIRLIFEEYGKTRTEIAEEIKEFIYNCNCDKEENSPATYCRNDSPEIIEFYAYYADYDWVVFCWLFGRMIDLPEGFPMYCIDLKQIMDEKKKAGKLVFMSKESGWDDLTVDITKHTDYPKQENEHNALDDAIWNRKLFKFLNKL